MTLIRRSTERVPTAPDTPTKGSDDYVDPLADIVQPLDRIEQQWFLNRFYPDYKRINEVIRDLEELANNEVWAGGASFARVSPGGNNLYAYTQDEVYERNGVSEHWVRTNVLPLVNPRGMAYDGDIRVGLYKLREAARGYAMWTASQHPRMPTDRLLELVHEFVPGYTRRSLQRALDDADLRDSRRRPDELLGLYKCQRQPGGQFPTAKQISDYCDELYEGDEYD